MVLLRGLLQHAPLERACHTDGQAMKSPTVTSGLSEASTCRCKTELHVSRKWLRYTWVDQASKDSCRAMYVCMGGLPDTVVVGRDLWPEAVVNAKGLHANLPMLQFGLCPLHVSADHATNKLHNGLNSHRKAIPSLDHE